MTVDRYQIPRWECLSLLESEPVGRVCIIEHGYPIALPVNYRLIGLGEEREIVIRTAPDTVVGRYSGPAAFEVDHIDIESREAWSVLVCGQLRHQPGAHGMPDPQPWLDSRHHWMVLSTAAVSGRRFVGAPGATGFAVEWELRPA
jgi:uncharacterized protein